MDPTTITLVIEKLEDVRRRPTVWMSRDIPLAASFLAGFNLACRALGVIAEHDHIYDEVLTKRGWKRTAAGPWQEMVEKGFDEEAITQELLTIEIETLKKRYHL